MILYLNLNYQIQNEISSNPELTNNYINFAVNSVYANGFETSSQRRTFARLQRKLDEALDQKLTELELAQDEKDLLVDVFSKNPKFPPTIAKYVVVLEEEIDKLKK